VDFVPVPDPTRKTSTRTRPIPAGTGRPAHLYLVAPQLYCFYHCVAFDLILLL